MSKFKSTLRLIRKSWEDFYQQKLRRRPLPPDPFGLPPVGGNGESERVKNLLIRTTGKDPSVP